MPKVSWRQMSPTAPPFGVFSARADGWVSQSTLPRLETPGTGDEDPDSDRPCSLGCLRGSKETTRAGPGVTSGRED